MMTKSHKLKKSHRKLKYLDLAWPPAGGTLEAGPGERRRKALILLLSGRSGRQVRQARWGGGQQVGSWVGRVRRE